MTIATLSDGGVYFAFASYLDDVEHWYSVPSFRELADAFHEKALEEYRIATTQGGTAEDSLRVPLRLRFGALAVSAAGGFFAAPSASR